MKKIIKHSMKIAIIFMMMFFIVSCKDSSKNHQHSFDMTTFETSDTEHWYKCKGCEEIYNKTEHAFDSGVQTEATYENEGFLTYTCYCGYSKTVVNQAKKEHLYSVGWTYDDNKHWHACLDTGYTSLKTDEAPHTLDSGVQTNATFDSVGYITYSCTSCDYKKQVVNQAVLTHNYSTTWSSNDSTHYHACIDAGYTNLKTDEAPHTDSNEVIITPASSTEMGLAEYTCSVCNHIYQKTIQIACSVTSLPTVNETVYVGETLSTVTLTGGSASVAGTFAWANPDEMVTSNTTYEIIFTPNDNRYATISGNVTINATQLTITVSCGNNGTVDKTGVINVNYGSNLTLNITPNSGYMLNQILVDGNAITNTTAYTFTNITSCHTLSVTFKEQPVTLETYTVAFDSNGGSSVASQAVTEGGTVTAPTEPTKSGYTFNGWTLNGQAYDFATVVTSNMTLVASWTQNSEIDNTLPFILTFVEGTDGAYTWDETNSTLTFNEVSADTIYIIAGTLEGNIVVNVGDTYKFELEMQGFTLTCSTTNPIYVATGDEFTLTAKSGYENFIYDTRDVIDETDETLYSGLIHSKVDTTIGGKGSLVAESLHNNGIHSTKDLKVKNLTLSVTSIDNALKGNDSVTITGGNITLISKQGDGIKTTDSDISTQGNQRGTVTITLATVNIYAACDGIDASYDVLIDDATTVLNIYTDKYSEYSETVTTTSESTYYIRYTNTYFVYGVKYYNSSNTSDYVWAYSSTTYETVSSSSNRPGGSSTTYYYYTVAKKTGYDKMIVYMYEASKTPNQDTNYNYVSSAVTVNDSYDTIKVSYSTSSGMSVSWTNYSTSSSTMPGGTGGMQEGNQDKGTYSTKGIKAANSITINAGTINIKAYDDAIHATKDTTTALENGSYGLGSVTINGGTLTLYSNDDGLHADGAMVITSGDISITNAYEGVEGNTITVSGGSIYVKSSDDGFNATQTSGAAITISGGEVYVYAGGDGVDSNSTTSKGAIAFKGGYVVIISTSGGNSAIDSEGGYSYTGGCVVAIMPTGMQSESYNCNNVGYKGSISLTANNYVTTKFTTGESVTIKMPTSISNGYCVVLGGTSAPTSSSSTSVTVDENGIYWAK